MTLWPRLVSKRIVTGTPPAEADLRMRLRPVSPAGMGLELRTLARDSPNRGTRSETVAERAS
jgi:hypothetical protein